MPYAGGGVGATGTVGPNLDVRLRTDCANPASEKIRGTTLKQCIETAITKPYAYLPTGYSAGIMPSNFAQRLTPDADPGARQLPLERGKVSGRGAMIDTAGGERADGDSRLRSRSSVADPHPRPASAEAARGRGGTERRFPR